MEFCLPDDLRGLEAAEKHLLDELLKRKAEFQLVEQNYPRNLNAKKTPAFYEMLVAHRKWQFAYEKKEKISRHLA